MVAPQRVGVSVPEGDSVGDMVMVVHRVCDSVCVAQGLGEEEGLLPAEAEKPALAQWLPVGKRVREVEMERVAERDMEREGLEVAQAVTEVVE